MSLSKCPASPSSAWCLQRLLRVCLVFLSVTSTVHGVHAAAPQTLALRGVVTDRSTGLSLNSTQQVLFRLYDTSTPGGVVLWHETFTLTFVEGNYQVVLGTDPANPLMVEFFRSGQVELGITIGNDAELQPRL